MINAFSIVIAIKVIDGITFSGDWWKIIIVGAILGFVNSMIRPVIMFFTFPFIILTLGLFTLIVNALMLILTSYLSDSFSLGLHISGFLPAFWGALVISIISTFLTWALGLKKIRIDHNKNNPPRLL